MKVPDASHETSFTTRSRTPCGSPSNTSSTCTHHTELVALWHFWLWQRHYRQADSWSEKKQRPFQTKNDETAIKFHSHAVETTITGGRGCAAGVGAWLRLVVLIGEDVLVALVDSKITCLWSDSRHWLTSLLCTISWPSFLGTHIMGHIAGTQWDCSLTSLGLGELVHFHLYPGLASLSPTSSGLTVFWKCLNN